MKEKTEYQSLTEVKAEKPSNLAELFGEKPEEVHTEEWQKHWQGMPAFEQNQKNPYKSLLVHFRNEQDYLEFQKKIEQPMTFKTRSCWYPELESIDHSLIRWIDAE